MALTSVERRFLEQLRQTDKDSGPTTTEGAISQAFGPDAVLPEIDDTPMWRKMVESPYNPLNIIQEHVFTPLAAAASEPVRSGSESIERGDVGMGQALQEALQSGIPLLTAIKGLTQYQPGTERREEYEQWEAPKYVKGVAETLPWFAIPTAGAMQGALSGGPKIAQLAGKALTPAVLGERAVGAVVGGAGRVASKAIKRAVPQIAKPTDVFAAPANEIIERQITVDDFVHRISRWFGRNPVTKEATELVGGKAATVGTTQAVEDVTARSLLLHTRVMETLLNARPVMLSKLRMTHPDPVALFGVDDLGRALKVKPRVAGASKLMADIAEHPAKYVLDERQLTYIKEVHRIEDTVLDAMRREGININELGFDEFSHYVHRKVIGKVVDGKLIEKAKGISPRIGGKQSFEKARYFEDAIEGFEKDNPLIYSGNLEDILDHYIRGAAKKIADQRTAKALESYGVKPLTRAYGMFPAEMEAAKVSAARYGAAKKLQQLANRSARGEKLPEASIKSVERYFPEEAARLRAGGKGLVKEAKALEESLKGPYWEARAARTKAMDVARQPAYGTEGTIAHPAFQGKIYPMEVAETINRYYDDIGIKALRSASTLSGEMRTLIAAADFSAMFIQGLPIMVRHPKAWAKAAAMSFRAFKSQGTYQKYLLKNAATINERTYYGGYTGGFEFTEAMPALQKTAATAGRVVGGAKGAKAGQAAIRQTYGRFEASFGSFGDVARNEMWKGMKSLAKDEQQLMELARHLDRMTGVMSSKALGIGPTQRSFESAFLFFAPRYTRATLSLIGDVFRGGMSGAEARKALASMLTGGAAMYAGAAEALGQEIKLDPRPSKYGGDGAQFMTMEVTDPVTGEVRHVGIGGAMLGTLRFLADLTSAAIEDPERLDLEHMNRVDNPFMKFMYQRTSPLTGAITELVEKKNYFGEPFEDKWDYAQFLLEKFTPIAAQSLLMEPGGFSPSTLVTEELGLRTFPQSDWERRDVFRDKLAQEVFGMPWDELASPTGPGKLAQRKLEQSSPELQAMTDRADEKSATMARGEGKIWNTWYKEGEQVETYYREIITKAAEEFSATRDGVTFRDKVNEAESNRRAMYTVRDKNPEFAEVKAYFNEPLDEKTLAQMNPLDRARREYYNLMYGPGMYDEYGNYNFAEADAREDDFTRQYGPQAVAYIEEYKTSKWNEPSALKALRRARSLLDPYWELESQIWAKLPPQAKELSDQIKIIERTDPERAKQLLTPQILWARRLSALLRSQMKKSDPEIKAALDIFYSY